jgi:hypothetical protein
MLMRMFLVCFLLCDPVSVTRACLQPFKLEDWSNQWIHVTNHGVQRNHASYTRGRNTLLFETLCQKLAVDHPMFAHDILWRRICDVVKAVFVAFQVMLWCWCWDSNHRTLPD